MLLKALGNSKQFDFCFVGFQCLQTNQPKPTNQSKGTYAFTLWSLWYIIYVIWVVKYTIHIFILYRFPSSTFGGAVFILATSGCLKFRDSTKTKPVKKRWEQNVICYTCFIFKVSLAILRNTRLFASLIVIANCRYPSFTAKKQNCNTWAHPFWDIPNFYLHYFNRCSAVGQAPCFKPGLSHFTFFSSLGWKAGRPNFHGISGLEIPMLNFAPVISINLPEKKDKIDL